VRGAAFTLGHFRSTIRPSLRLGRIK
jgi:hypothetical protein